MFFPNSWKKSHLLLMGHIYSTKPADTATLCAVKKLVSTITSSNFLSLTKTICLPTAITLPVKTGPIAGTGYESGNNNPIGVNGERAPEGFDQGLQHLVSF